MRRHKKNSTNGSNTSASVGTKVLGVVGLCLVLLIAVAGVSIRQMSRIGHEIVGVAERDLPLTGAVTKVTTHQLEQAIQLERALRAGGVRETDADATSTFAASFAKFTELAALVDEEIKRAGQIARSALKAAETEEARVLFEEVDGHLARIVQEHKDFDERAREAFDFAKVGNLEAARALLPAIKQKEAALDQALEQMLDKVEGLTNHAATVAEEHERFALNMLLILSTTAVVLGLLLSWFLVRRAITRPLAEVVAGLDALSADDLSFDVKVYSDDEIGAVAKAYDTFKQTLARARELEAAQKEHEARAAEERRRMMNELADQFDTSVGSIIGAVASAATELNTAAQSMASVSEETCSQATSVAAASEQSSANVSSVAAATQELSQSIEEINRQTSETSKMSRQAVTQTGETSAQVAALATATDRIGEVIALISDIADQTNLLALNATIESARAGAAGKGFAVVASEVKALASETSKATEEIARQIQDVQTATHNSVGSIGEVGQIISQLDQAATAIAAAMEEQGTATREIAHNVQQAADGNEEIAGNIVGVTQASQEAGAAASQVLSASQDLSKQAEMLKGQVDSFMAEVRAG